MNRRWPISYHHAAIAVMLLVCFYFGTRFSTAAVMNRRLALREEASAAKVAQLKAANRSYQKDLSYYRSDTYIEQAARNQLGLMLPGDHVLRVASSAVTPTPTPTVKPAPAPRKPTAMWQRWWRLFVQPTA